MKVWFFQQRGKHMEQFV